MKRNKILSAVLVIVMLFSILTASTIFGSSDVVHPGDVNGDGVVCLKDLFVLQRYVRGVSTWIPRPKNPPELSAEKEYQISNDLEEQLGSQRRFVYYLGTYSGNIALVVRGSWTVHWNQEIAGFMFRFPWGPEPTMIWYDGEFIGLTLAYEQDIVTRQDVGDIHYYFSCRFRF